MPSHRKCVCKRGENRCSIGCEAHLLRGIIMLINEQYILKEGSYIADIASADFLLQ